MFTTLYRLRGQTLFLPLFTWSLWVLFTAIFKLRFTLVYSSVQTDDYFAYARSSVQTEILPCLVLCSNWGLILFTAPYKMRSSSVQTEVILRFQLCSNWNLTLFTAYFWLVFYLVYSFLKTKTLQYFFQLWTDWGITL